jgi:hypothetical protein
MLMKKSDGTCGSCSGSATLPISQLIREHLFKDDVTFFSSSVFLSQEISGVFKSKKRDVWNGCKYRDDKV